MFWLIGERLADLYAKAEDAYYGLMDWLDAKGIPLYAFNDFLEQRGIPAFPVTVGIIVLVLALLFFFVFVGTGIEPTLTLEIKDDAGNGLSAVQIVVLNETSGAKLFDEKKSNHQAIELKRLGAGTRLKVSASKDGYETASYSFELSSQSTSVPLVLKKRVKSIIGTLKLVDEKTGTVVRKALVSASWGKDFSRQVESDANGLAQFVGIPEGEKISVTIKADNYEELTEVFSFTEGQTLTVSLPQKSTALFGNAKLTIRVFEAATRLLVDGARIQLFAKESDKLLFEGIAIEGQYVADVPSGTALRIVAQKDGFARYDSLEETEEGFTVLEKENVFDIYLLKGGTRVKVNVKSKDAALPLSAASVSLYDAFGKRIDENFSGFGGSVEFSDLNADANYFVSAFLDGYLPATKKFSPMLQPSIDLALESMTSKNSATLGVFVSSASGAPGNDAALLFYSLEEGDALPLGLPETKTAFDGYASVKMPVGKNILVKASKGIEAGDANKFIEAGIQNNVAVYLKVVPSARIVKIFDVKGNPLLEGTALVTDAAGNVLFDGNVSRGGIIFDAAGNKTVIIKVTTLDGNVFEEQLNVEGKGPFEFRLAAANVNALAPQIKYLGIFDAEGKQVEGLTPGTDYWLKFETNWIKGQYKGSLHFRVGDDTVKFADSDEIGILGFDAAPSDFFYGRSYSPIPAPGNEGIDFRNAGRAGSFNKWLELYYNNPAGTKIVKVKVQAKQGTLGRRFAFNYRGWSLVGTDFHRNPADEELEQEAFTETKTGLYAETLQEELVVFERQPKCQKELCAEYKFLSKDGSGFDPKDFKALKDRQYALEITFSAKKAMAVTAKASTAKEKPRINFTAFEVQSFSAVFPDSNMLNSGLEAKELGVLESGELKLRFYFKPLATGATSIKLQSVAGTIVLNEEFYFNVFEEKKMLVTVMPEEIGVGKDFTVTVKSEDGSAIENATVQLKDSEGKIAGAIVGNAQEKTGAEGQYFFKNGFEAGAYLLEVTAFGFAPYAQPLIVSAEGLLKINGQFNIDLPPNTMTKTETSTIENASAFTISEIGYEIKKAENFPAEFDIIVSLPSQMKKKEKTRISVTATYLGDANAELSGEADLIVFGDVAERYPTRTISRVIVTYNKRFDSNCLYVNRKGIDFLLSGQDGSQGEQFIEVKNNCPYPLDIQSQVLPKQAKLDNYLVVNSEDFTLQQGQTKTVSVTAMNKLQRYYPERQTRAFDLFFNSPYVSRSMPVNVSIWDAPFMLEARDTIVLYLSQGAKGENPVASTPLLMRNAGRAEIRDISIAVSYEAPLDNYYGSNPYNLPMPQNYAYPYSTYGYQGYSGAGVAGGVFPSAYSPEAGYLAYGQQATSPYSGVAGGVYPTAYSPTGMATVPNQGREDFAGIDVRITPTGNVPILPPGASPTPPKMVVATMPGGTKEARAGRGYLNISGTVNGMRHVLKNIEVLVFASAFNCLKAFPVDDMVFESTEATTGVIDKRIKVRNECEEPVRIADIEPNKFGANQFSIVAKGNSTLAKGMEEEFLVRLVKKQEFKNENASFVVVGLATVTQKFLKTDKLNASIALGEKAVASGAASAPFTVNVCNDDGTISKETKQVQFPLIASGTECDKAYCDATQLAEFLAQRLQLKLQQAKNAIGKGSVATANFAGCAETASSCGFSKLGIRAESLEVFFSNDALTTELMKKALQDKGSTELKPYAVNYCSGSQCNAETVAATGYNNILFLSDSFRGCGKYRVKIDGAAFASGGQVSAEGFILVASVSSRQSTPECSSQVQNAMNFLPKDKGLDGSSPFNAWPGIAEASDELKPIGEAFAKELFESEKGRVSGATSSNKIKPVFGELKAGIVKVSMEPGITTVAPRTVTATINQAFKPSVEAEATGTAGTAAKDSIADSSSALLADAGTAKTPATPAGTTGEPKAGETKTTVEPKPTEPLGTPTTTPAKPAEKPSTVSSKIASEAARAISSLKSHRLEAGKSCISRDGTFMVIGSYARIGELKIEGKAALSVSPQERCIDLNAVSELEEAVYLKTNLEQLQRQNVGIDKVFFRQAAKRNKQGELLEQGRQISSKEAVRLKYDLDNKKIFFPFQVCVVGNAQFSLAKSSLPLKVSAQSVADPLRKSKEHDIALNICAIHPYDLLDNLSELKAKTAVGKPQKFFATIAWKGEPGTIKLSSLLNGLNAAGQLKLAEDNAIYGKGVNPGKTYEGFWKSKTNKATLGYLAACIPASAVCNAGFFGGIGAAVFGAIMDCGLPALHATGWSGWVWDNIWSFFGSNYSEMKDVTEAEKAAIMGEAEKAKAEGTLGEYLWDYAVPGVTGGTAEGLIYGIGASSDIITDSTAESYAALRSQVLAEEMYTRTFGSLDRVPLAKDITSIQIKGVTTSFSAGGSISKQDMVQILKERLQKETAEYLKRFEGPNTSLKKGIFKITPNYTIAEKADEAVTKAIEKLGEDADVKQVFGGIDSTKLLTEAADLAKANAAAAIGEAVQPENLARTVQGKFVQHGETFGVSAGGILSKTPGTGGQAVFDNMLDKIWTGTSGTATAPAAPGLLDTLNSQLGGTLGPEAQAALKSRIATGLEDKLREAGVSTVTPSGTTTAIKAKFLKGSDVVDAIKAALEDFAKDPKFKKELEKMPGVLSKASEKIAPAMAKSSVDIMKANVKGAVTKSEWWKNLGKKTTSTFFSKPMLKNLSAGVFCGVAANAAGAIGWKVAWNKMKDSSVASTEFKGPASLQEGKLALDDKSRIKRDSDIENGASYVITLSKSKAGGEEHLLVEFSDKLTELAAVPQDAVSLNTDCDGSWAQRGIREAVLPLHPTVELAGPYAVLAYGKTGEKITAVSGDLKVPAEVIIAALVSESNYPRATGGCGNWLSEENQEKADEIVDCTAKGIAKHYKGTSDAELKKAFKAFRPDASQEYLDKALYTYKVWNNAKKAIVPKATATKATEEKK